MMPVRLTTSLISGGLDTPTDSAAVRLRQAMPMPVLDAPSVPWRIVAVVWPMPNEVAPLPSVLVSPAML